MIEILSESNSYYTIQIKLPLRTYVVKKRYSDFETLLNNLAYELGINIKDFPYQLPGKRLNWINKSNIIEERKIELGKFLNNLIQDKEFQNNEQVREFLQFPNNFKFQQDKWYGLFKRLKIELQNENLTREKIHKYQSMIQELKTDDKEKQRLLKQLEDKLVIQPEIRQPGRIIGKETKETIPLSNQELLQQQINTHHAQDQEVEQLRVLISRQRQIGELINTEVEEQNLMLDQFNEEVDQTSDRIKKQEQEQEKFYNFKVTYRCSMHILITCRIDR